MAEPKNPRTNQGRQGLVVNGENQELKPPPRRKKSLRKNKMEADNSRKIAASHSGKPENEQLTTSLEEKVVEERNSAINADNNNTDTAVLRNNADKVDSKNSQEGQLSNYSVANECEVSKSTAQNKSDNTKIEEPKAGGTPGSFSGCKMTIKNEEVSKIEKRNVQGGYDVVKEECEVGEDDQMGNKNGSIKTKKNTQPCEPGNTTLTDNDKSGIKDCLNGNQEAKSGDDPIVVDENFETFCLVENAATSDGENQATNIEQDSKETHLKSKENGSRSCSNLEKATSGISPSNCESVINSDVDTNSKQKCVPNSASGKISEDFLKDDSVLQQVDQDKSKAETNESASQLETNDIDKISEHSGLNAHQKISNSQATEVESQDNTILAFQNPLCVIDVPDFETGSSRENELMQKECVPDSTASDLKRDNSLPEKTENIINGMNQEMKGIEGANECSVPYENLDENPTTLNQDGMCEEFEEEEYSTDTDSDTYYSDFTSSEGEYDMEDAEKLNVCDDKVFNQEEASPVSREAEPEHINQILSVFQETETVTVTDQVDGSMRMDADDGRHGNEPNTGLELSEDRALSLKRKIGSFKVVESLEPEVEKDVKKAAVGMATEAVAMETESSLDTTKTAELAIRALQKEHRLKRKGRGRELRKSQDIIKKEQSGGKLEISRPRSIVGEPRIRSRSTGDLDGKKTKIKKMNSLPARATRLRRSQDSQVNFDMTSELPLFDKDNAQLPGVLEGGLIASMTYLEGSRERRESGSPLFKEPSLKRESESKLVTEVGSGEDRAPTSQENDAASVINPNISSSTEKPPEPDTSPQPGKTESSDLQEQGPSSENLTVVIQVDSRIDETGPIRRSLSTVREESSSSLESGPSISLSSQESSISQESKTQADEATSSTISNEPSPNANDTITNLEKWELNNGIRDEGSTIEKDETLEQKLTTPVAIHKQEMLRQENNLSQSAPSKMTTSSQTPVSSELNKSSGSLNNIQQRQLKITKAKRKWLSQSAVITSGLPESEQEVKLTSFKKNGEPDSKDSGVTDRQTVSESPGEEKSEAKTRHVTFTETPGATTERELKPTPPPRRTKLSPSQSFATTPRTSRADTTSRTAVKASKTRPRAGSRWQTLSGAIDAGMLARLSSASKPPLEQMSEEQITLVTDAIPACFPTFPTDKRAQIALELYTTERTYVRGLEIVIELFKNPLEDYLEPKEKTAMFSNIEDIFKLNKDVLFSLCEKVNHWRDDQVIGDIFVENASRFKIYATYCNNYDAAETLIKQKIKKKKEFDDFLEACYENDVCQPGLKLPAYLITVVQRIPRYLLLLRDLVKCTPAHHPDARAIKDGLHKMNNIAEYINNQLQAVQGQQAMTELRSRVIGIKAFETPGRSLIKEGEVYIMSTKRTYKCLLFNDMVVFAAKNVNKRSEVELTLELETIWVSDLEDNDPQTSKEDAIELYTPERSYTMYAGTRNEKKHWLQKLRTAIAIRLHGEMATDSSEIGHRKSDFTYKDGRIYCGIFVDAKRHGHGVLAWQNRTRYVGNFEDDERNGIGELTYSTGEKYNGEWLDDKQHGVGTLTYPNNDVYTGEWKRGKMNGKAMIQFSNDDHLKGEFVDNEVCGNARLECTNGLIYDGAWRNSKKHGNGTLIKPNGDTYSGDFSNDRINGKGTMVYASNKATYKGQWENNQRHGTGVYSVPDGTRYEGEWRGDHMSGRGKMRYGNGDTYDGSWYRDMRFGKGNFHCQEGIYDGKFEYNVRHGFGIMHYKDNSSYEGDWQHDQRHGHGKMTYADSSVYEGNWMLSLRNGRGKMTYPNGATYEGNWDLGSEHGQDGVFMDNANNYSYEGCWEYGCKHGPGIERTSSGTYEGDFKANMRNGKGVETLTCRTVYEGHWRDNRKVGEVLRKTKWGETETTEVQYWKEGQLLNKDETIAPDLPFIQRITTK